MVGFMCSGKSVVGRLLAELLSWDFLDFDEAIERSQNKRVADIFRDDGEPFFRALDAEVTETAVGRRNVVIAPGGGWITQPELVGKLRPGGLMVWLRVRPSTVYERDRDQPEIVRPLLATDDPLSAISAILERRTPLYEQADVALDTDDRDPLALAEEIAAILRREPT